MTSDRSIQIAADVLARCQSKDAWFPHVGDAIILGWAQTFEDSGLGAEDLLAGVEHAYSDAPEGFRPLPSTIVQHGRAAYFEQLKALPDEKRQLMEDANHILQDFGFAPPDAHRWSRRIALGRSVDLALTAEQSAELRRRLEQRKQLAETEPRHLRIAAMFPRPEAS